MQDLPRRPLPPRPPLVAMLGPGLVWMALAQGSGELIWWPYIVAKYGAGFLFLLIPACLLQFPVTFEIARYTALSGEGIVRGFFRLGRWYGAVVWVLFTISFLWFGAFASAGGTAIAALTEAPAGWSVRGQTLFWAQLSIVVFTIALLWARRAYRLIEIVMKVIAVVSLVGMVAACLHPAALAALGDFARALVVPDVDAMRGFDRADADELLTAIAFAGLGGFWTLFYSYWMREKGVGMASGGAGLPAASPEAQSRLRAWYRYLSVETLIGIVGNLFTTLMTCLLAYAILRPQGLVPDQFRIAVVQSEFFAASWGTAGRLLFLVIAGAFLADTWLATVDSVARIHLDVAGSLWPSFARRDQRRWYRILVVALAVITSVTMYLDQPGALIVISALVGFTGTVIYAVGLLVLNHVHVRRALPPELRSGRLAIAAIGFATVCYLALAIGYVVVKYG
jgi:Mn2+/Fe2+ NRAMP family transporter